MKFLSFAGLGQRLLLVSLLTCPSVGVLAQGRNTSTVRAPAAVLRVRVLQDKDAPGIEITSSQPIVPVVNKLDGPPRIVVDLADTVMSVASKQIPVQSDRISAVRYPGERHPGQAPAVHHEE